MTTVSRREFVSVLTAAGGSLLLGYRVGEGQRVASVASAPGFAPNAFIRIAPDGSITLFHATGRNGPGHAHVDVHAFGGRARGHA